MKQYYLAVDIGASSGRHILGSLENGKLVLEEVYRFPNATVKKNGTRCWDHEALFANLLEGMKACAKLGKIPVYMGIDTWGVDFALLDANGNLIGDTVGYRDSRTRGMDALVESLVSPKELYERTGIQKQICNTIYQLMALKTNAPAQLDAADSLLMMPDYLNFRLTGVRHQEYTEATTSGLINIHTGAWDTELLSRLGYPQHLFGTLSMPGDTVGRLSPDVVQKVGYDLTVLHAPSHDTASAVLAVPTSSENALYISSGTWSLMGVERREAVVTDRARECNLTNEGGYDRRYRILKNIMGLWIIQSIKAEVKDYSFAELCDMARRVGDTTARINVNDDAFLAPDSMIEAIRSYCKRPDMPLDEMLCCVYHSLAEAYAQTATEVSNCTGSSPSALHIVGGGSRDDFLNELTAKACGIPVYAGPTEATAIGNLLCQMLTSGVFATVAEARAVVASSFDIKPITAEQT